MSFVDFDDIYEICCGMCYGMMAEEEVLSKVKEEPTIERLDLMKNHIPDSNE